MNSITATEHICTMLNEQKKITAQEINYTHQIALVQVYGIMKKLEMAGLIEKVDQENGKMYVLKDKDTLLAYMSSLKKNTEIEVKTVTAQKNNQPKNGRDTSKFMFQKKVYPKGQCALAVVRVYVQENKKVSLDQLRTVFPDEIIGSRLGVIQSLANGKKISDQIPRYFMKDEQILKTSDGGSCVVCSQWTSERFEKFCKVAKDLGYKISRV